MWLVVESTGSVLAFEGCLNSGYSTMAQINIPRKSFVGYKTNEMP